MECKFNNCKINGIPNFNNSVIIQWNPVCDTGVGSMEFTLPIAYTTSYAVLVSSKLDRRDFQSAESWDNKSLTGFTGYYTTYGISYITIGY